MSLHLKLIRSTETAYKTKIANNKQKSASLGEGRKSDFQSYNIIRSNVQFSTRNHKVNKETVKYGPFKGKK